MLHQLQRGGFDIFTLGCDDFLKIGAAHQLAHGTFGHSLHRFRLVAQIEDEIFRLCRINLPDNTEFNIGDIFIPGEHQAFFRHHANVDALAVCDRRLDHRADRIRQVIIQARLCFAGITAKNHIQAHFVGLHRIKAGQQPDHKAQHHKQNKAAPVHPAAARQAIKPVFQAAKQIVTIDRPFGPLPPGTGCGGLPGAAAVISAVLIAPGHKNLICWTSVI